MPLARKAFHRKIDLQPALDRVPLGDLVEVEAPRKVMLYAPVVTKDNVDQYMPTGFR